MLMTIALGSCHPSRCLSLSMRSGRHLLSLSLASPYVANHPVASSLCYRKPSTGICCPSSPFRDGGTGDEVKAIKVSEHSKVPLDPTQGATPFSRLAAADRVHGVRVERSCCQDHVSSVAGKGASAHSKTFVHSQIHLSPSNRSSLGVVICSPGDCKGGISSGDAAARFQRDDLSGGGIFRGSWWPRSQSNRLSRHCRLFSLDSSRAAALCTQRIGVAVEASANTLVNGSDELGVRDERQTVKGKPRVIVLAGPTGAGKSSLAIEVAKRVGGEIISADSVQIYKGLDVGSGKIAPEEREGIPHHMLDIAYPTEPYSAGDFCEDAHAITEDILARGRVPIIVGGTGMYLRWYIHGKPALPHASEGLKATIEAEMTKFRSMESGGWDAAVEALATAGDAESAAKLSRNDWFRMRRAFEILRSSGKPRSAFQLESSIRISNAAAAESANERGSGLGDEDGGLQISTKESSSSSQLMNVLDYEFQCYFIFLPRDALYRKIDARCEEMVLDGLLREASWMLDQGILPDSSPPSRAIGYRQAMDYLQKWREEEEEISHDDFLQFLSEFQQASRKFAKRQTTWFRSDDMYHWVDSTRTKGLAVNLIVGAYERSERKRVPVECNAEYILNSYKEGKKMKYYWPKYSLFNTHKNRELIMDWIRKYLQTEKASIRLK